MTRLNKILGGVLALQLVVAVLVLSRGGETVKLKQEPVLPGFDAATVTRLQVFENGGAKPGVDLVKRGTSWVLASHWDYPADTAKVEAALAPLAKMTAGDDPVATSTARHKQQKVGDTDFEKKLVISSGGKETILFIGTSKARRTSVRLAGEERVLGATGVSAPAASARDWIAGNYSEIPRDDIDKITIQKGTSTIELDRTAVAVPTGSGSAGSGSAGSGAGSGSATAERSWRLAIDGIPVVLAAGEKLDTFAIDSVVSAVAAIDATPADPKRATQGGSTVTVTKKGGVAVVFDVVADGQSLWVKQRGNERATTIDKQRFEPLLGADRGKLVSKPEPVPGAGSGSAVGFPPMPMVPPPQP